MPEKRSIPRRTRRSRCRDAKLIIIAAEGQKTEKKYLEAVAEEYYNPRIHVKVLDRKNSASDPKHVLEQLNRFRSEYDIQRGYDELWLVIDIDRWRAKKLSEVAELCSQKNYWLAVSNPCFELWLLLHLKSLDEYDEETLNEFRENKGNKNRTQLELELVKLLENYNKRDPDITPFLPFVEAAINRAKKLDTHPEERWPNDLGSRVYLIAEKIIAK
jgi:hypothetical protein